MANDLDGFTLASGYANAIHDGAPNVGQVAFVPTHLINNVLRGVRQPNVATLVNYKAQSSVPSTTA